MRRILTALPFAALVLAGLPGVASAECGCACNMGQAIGVCSLPYEHPPICQRLCPQTLSQQITTPSLSTTLSPGSLYGSGGGGAAPAGVSPTDAAAAAALLGGGGAAGLGGGAGGSQAAIAAAAAAAGLK